jgi:F-type H+-transporting ATPase subunit c
MASLVKEETNINVWGFVAVALAILFPAMASALAQGWATSSAMQGISRQPEAAGDVRSTLLISLAFMEALTLFSFVIAILIWVKL